MEIPLGSLSERHFLCSLCEQIFSHPVTTPCGHSFCKACLRVYWSRSGTDECPLCRRAFSGKLRVSVNRTLADVTDRFRKTRLVAKSTFFSTDELQDEPKSPGEVERMISERVQKIDKLRESLKILKSTSLREVQESQRVFSLLLSELEKSHKALVTAVEQKQREAEKRVERLVKDLEREILELQNEHISPEHLNDMERLKKSLSHIPRPMRDWSKVTLETDPCVGFTRQAVVDFMDIITVEAKRLSKTELRRLQKYSADVNLNPQTAHAYLYVSENRKEVRHANKRQEVPENPKRFDRVINVMSKEAFRRGRHLWEVEVGDKTDWDLGVGKQSVNRKGKFTVCPSNGFWVLSLRNGTQYVANTVPPTFFSLTPMPKKLSIYLDCEEGRLSFYCSDTGTHIYTFKDAFTEKLHPLFSPGRPHGERNCTPLVINSSCCSI
ncbi:hypothetical protein DNTS_006317 [Danionella cerebrum]|uniref:RING-type domain-containing protein n=1 Tax=Danionella cerebrum TaxID=2873325 RepID=A0A553QT90_9TELE|nr:hypothetical protein DNTS_006317 [Danionella translucida]